MKKIYILLGRASAVGLGISLLFTASAFAADLNWSADTNITIGGNTYVIVSGSAATSLVVSGISATVAVPSGSTFTLKSTDRFLFTTSPTLEQTCSTADNRVTVIGAITSEVITPTVGTTCTVNNGAGSPSGGGSPSAPPASTPTPTPTPGVTPTPTPGTTPTPSPTPPPTTGSKATPASKGFVTLAKLSIKEGDTISASGSSDPDIYIANAFGYKRLFLNPAIFNFYGHLGGFKKVKKVVSTTRDTLVTSGLFRNCETNDPKVYGVETTGEDTGTLHWVNTSGTQAVADDANFFKKVFCINSKEFGWYQKGTTYTSVNEVPDYNRVK